MITRNDDDDRASNRYVLAYALSIFIHSFILALFAVHILLPADNGSSAPQTETVAVTTQRSTISSAAPITPAPVSPPQQTPPPQTPPPRTPPPKTPPPQTPPPRRVSPRHVVARPRIVRRAPRKSVLAVIVSNGTPEPQHITIVAPEVTLPPPVPDRLTAPPSPEPSVATIAPTLPPVKPTPRPETPKPQTPVPTIPPTIAPTVQPTVAPTLEPTTAPTLRPTAAPTLRPTVAPTARSTVAPTAPPTVAPTLAPTAKATVAPTARPTVAPTAKPTAAATTAPTAKATAAPSPIPATAAPAAVARVTPAPPRVPGQGFASAPPHALASAPGGSATAGSKAGSGAAGSATSPAASGGAEGSGGHKGVVAYATPGGSSSDANGSSVSNLNKRLNALLPSGSVTYQSKEYVGDLNAAVDQAKAAAIAEVAPPQSVLDRAIAVVKQRGVLLDASNSIVYILKRQRIFGFNICTGWKISYPAGGGPPQGGYTIGPCSGEAFAPSGGLPTLPPKAPPSP